MENRYQWELKKYDYTRADEFARELGILPATARLLAGRGLLTCEEARQYLYPSLDSLQDPFCLNDMDKAVQRIELARSKGEKVVVYGDYDVDGICSTVILKECFEMLGIAADYYIPDRFSEGYGLNIPAVEKLALAGYNLLVSVDCGIRSCNEVLKACQLGMDVIITDHHMPGETLPRAVAVVNPRIGNMGSDYHLAGAGVAYKLAAAVGRGRLPAETINSWLDLVALATVADIVPLTGDNRVLVKHGLQQIQNSHRKGLKVLLEENRLEGKTLNTWHLGYILAPRLNSAGRLDSARNSVELLLTLDNSRAVEIARLLNNLNSERKSREEIIFKEAVLRVENELQPETEAILVLDSNNWHLGVTGIVASRLSERYCRPVILISWEGETGKGSCRSIKGIDINQGLFNCSEYLIEYGGHPMAAGLSIQKSQYPAFKKAINRWVRENAVSDKFRAAHIIDIEIDIDEINKKLLRELQLLEPFGEGNPPPLLLLRCVELNQIKMVGKKKEHFKARLTPSNHNLIAFNKPGLAELPCDVCYSDLIFLAEENEFRGQKDLQLRALDIKPSYLPDCFVDKGGAGKSSLILHTIVQEIQHNRPVLCIFPTYRIMHRFQKAMEAYLSPGILCEIHGRLSKNARTRRENQLTAGEPRVYIITEAYLEYYMREKKLPGILKHIRVWPVNVELLPEIKDEYQVEILFPALVNLEWKRETWDSLNGKRRLIYTNRGSTVNRLSAMLDEVMIEAGVGDIKKRTATRKRFAGMNTGNLLMDGSFAGLKLPFDSIDEILFADAPFSSFETRIMLEQIKNHSENTVKVGALFNHSDLESNEKYLSRLYPDINGIKEVWSCLKNTGRREICQDIAGLAKQVGAALQCNFTAFDLLPVLQILVDLDLCRVRKKGSIIEIIFLNRRNSTLEITDSPYWLEGLAEKKACASFRQELEKSLVW